MQLVAIPTGQPGASPLQQAAGGFQGGGGQPIMLQGGQAMFLPGVPLVQPGSGSPQARAPQPQGQPPQQQQGQQQQGSLYSSGMHAPPR